jgi:Ca2+-binding EF-hand superfamily protein
MCEMAEHCGVEIDFTDVFKQFAGSDDPEATLGRDKIEKALKALEISKEISVQDVLDTMDADKSGDIDLHEWTTCMTKELRRAIERKLNNKDKIAGFRPLVDMAKVFDQFDTDNSGSLSKAEIKNAMKCLGLKGWDWEQMFESMDQNADGEISIQEFKDGVPSQVLQIMSGKLNDMGLIEGFTS